MRIVSKMVFFIGTASLLGMNGEEFIQRFSKTECNLGTLSDDTLRSLGEQLCLQNYSTKDVIALGRSIIVPVQETSAKRIRDAEPYTLPRAISVGDSTVTVRESTCLQVRHTHLSDSGGARFNSPVLILALSSSGNKLCVGCGKSGAVEELVFFGISAYRFVLIGLICDLSYPCIPYSLQWGNDEETITLYGRVGTDYRKLVTKMPDALFFLKNYEYCKSGD